MAVTYLFPTPVAHKICNVDIDSLINYLYDLKKSDNSKIEYSNVKGWHSPANLNYDPKIFEKMPNLMNDIKELVLEMGISTSVINIKSMWSMINPPGAYNHSHKHGMCSLSGVIYLKTPQNSGRIIFENSLDSSIGLCERIKNPEFSNNFASYKFDPKPNLLLLFHSQLRHYVEMNESNEDRISISFNIDLQ